METPPTKQLGPLQERFGASYWQEATHYGRLGEYGRALTATMRWYEGLVNAVEPFLPTDGRHLDVGCGHGALVHLMRQRGLESYGFDASEWMIENIREAAPELAECFQVGDAEGEIPFKGTFDLITCAEVLEHLNNPELALKSIRSRLSPGGVAVLTTPNPSNFMPFRNPAMNDPTHVNVHEPVWWRATLERRDLTPITSWTYVALPYLWRYSPRLAHWFKFRRDIAPGWLVVCRSA